MLLLRPPKGSFAHSVWVRLIVPRVLLLTAFWSMNQSLQLPVWLAYLLVAGDAVFLLWQIARYHSAAEAHIRDTGAMALSWAAICSACWRSSPVQPFGGTRC